MSARAVVIAVLLGACGDNLPSPFADPTSIEVVSMPVIDRDQRGVDATDRRLDRIEAQIAELNKKIG